MTGHKPMVAELRVKVKSLAAEARIIRLEERRARTTAARESLYFHRIRDVRREARAALLAYAFIRGRDYATCEKPGKWNPPDLVRVQQLVVKFGVRPSLASKGMLEQELKAWIAGTLERHPFETKRDLAGQRSDPPNLVGACP